MRAYLGSSPKTFYECSTHSHECWEIMLCLRGTGTVVINGHEYDFWERTIFCIPPHMPHSKRSEHGYCDHSMYVTDFVPPNGNSILILEDDGDHTFTNLMNSARLIQLQRLPSATQFVEFIANAMCQLLLSWSQVERTQRDEIDAFQQVLMENISNCTFDITAAIAQTGYSASHFRKLFKAALGQSPLSYFNHLRIEYSKTLLCQAGGSLSIREIANNSGYSDPYYYSRLFKAYTGCSPSSYVSTEFDNSLL